MLGNKDIDLYQLHKLVMENGGMEEVRCFIHFLQMKVSIAYFKILVLITHFCLHSVLHKLFGLSALSEP